MIGLETLSLMPLIELTPRTFPLQNSLSVAVENNTKFAIDRYSVTEARNQIQTSFDNALRSLAIAQQTIERDNISDISQMQMIFIKALAENWYGREETLRWCDALLKIKESNEQKTFLNALKDAITKKKEAYYEILRDNVSEITINADNMMSYWISPKCQKNFSISINIINNKELLQNFFAELQPILISVYKEKVTMNDVIDFYHLYSLYFDGNIKEVWSCNQNFVKKHEKYLKALNSDKFSRIFSEVKIRRIK